MTPGASGSGEEPGSPRARLAEAFRQRDRMLYPTAMSLCGEPGQAEELVQETFYRALVHIEQYDPSRPIAPWLKQILRNLFLDDKKSSRTKRTRSCDDELAEDFAIVAVLPAPEDELPEEAAAVSRIRAAVNEAIGRLPGQQIDMVEKAMFTRLGYPDLAAAEGVSIRAVRQRLLRARKRLRSILKAEERVG